MVGRKLAEKRAARSTRDGFLGFPRELLRSSWPWAPRSPIQSGISAAGTCAVDRTIAARDNDERGEERAAGGQRFGSSAHSHGYVRGRYGFIHNSSLFLVFPCLRCYLTL